MSVYIVVNQTREWPAETQGATIVSARSYLTDPMFAENRTARVLNLCRTDRYQSRGYYVSLLAEARGHRPVPEVKTIEDLHNGDPAHFMSAGFSQQIQRALSSNASLHCELDSYFGHDPAGVYESLAQQLFGVFRAPLLRAKFERGDEQWQLRSIHILSIADIEPERRPQVAEAAEAYLSPAKTRSRLAPASQLSLAVLYNDDEPDPPSNTAALEKFCVAAAGLGMRAQLITRGDIERLSGFDGLFIRDTTNVNHYTYQFARRALAEGLVVIDDPDSILKCTNKVYLKELLTRHRVPVPKTLMVHRDNVGEIVPTLGLPCIVKQPDSAFSLGVAKVERAELLPAALDALFEKSDLVVAQEWVPTEFDWRVGVLDRRPLYVCKYFMAAGHWQVVKRETDRRVDGSTVALTVGEVPENVVKNAVKAANLIGDGLYGVDLKQVGEQAFVIEVNDNPNIDAGNEDGVLGDALYREVMGVFLRRIQERKRGASR